MKTLAKIPNIRHSFYYDIIRLAVGIILFTEGIKFLNNREMLYGIIENSRVGGLAFILEHHVIFTLLAGGILIAVGLLTRIVVLFELLIFVGVLFNHHAEFGLFSIYGNFAFSMLVTALLILIFIAGSGKHSADHYLKSKKKN